VAELPATRREEQNLNLECLIVFEGCEGCGAGGMKLGGVEGVGMTGDD